MPWSDQQIGTVTWEKVGQRCYVYVFMFFNWPGDFFPLGTAWRQTDKYIAPGGKFSMLFMYLIVPIGTRYGGLLPIRAHMHRWQSGWCTDVEQDLAGGQQWHALHFQRKDCVTWNWRVRLTSEPNIEREFTLRCMLTIAFFELHLKAKLKALPQELDMKHTWCNLMRAQNNSR